MFRLVAVPIACAVVIAACGTPTTPSTPARTGGTAVSTLTPATTATSAIVDLAKGGSFTIQLRPDKAPKTVTTFVRKARAGDYDGTTFHRVVAGFVAQGGDPLSKTLAAGDPRIGTGGGTQDTELSDLPFTKAAVGIARGGDIKVSNDSQFFVVLADAPHLNGAYTNFGTVTGGMDVVLAIQIGDKIKGVRIP